MLSFKQKRKATLIKVLNPVSDAVESWFLNVGLEFIKSRKLTDKEENVIEEFTDYYLDSLKQLK